MARQSSELKPIVDASPNRQDTRRFANELFTRYMKKAQIPDDTMLSAERI